MKPSSQPLGHPSRYPTCQPSAQPSAQPSSQSSFRSDVKIPAGFSVITTSPLSVLTSSPDLSISRFKIVLPFMHTNCVVGDNGLSDVTLNNNNVSVLGANYVLVGGNSDVSLFRRAQITSVVRYDFSGRSVSNAG